MLESLEHIVGLTLDFYEVGEFSHLVPEITKRVSGECIKNEGPAAMHVLIKHAILEATGGPSPTKAKFEEALRHARHKDRLMAEFRPEAVSVAV